MWISVLRCMALVASWGSFRTRYWTHAPTITVHFNSVQSLSHDQHCDLLECSMPGLPAHHQFLELTQTYLHWWSVRPSNHLIHCHPLLLPSLIFSSIMVFSNESASHIRWPKYWSFSFNISPSSEYSGLIFFKKTGLISLLSKGISKVFSNTTGQKHQFFSAQLSL